MGGGGLMQILCRKVATLFDCYLYNLQVTDFKCLRHQIHKIALHGPQRYESLWTMTDIFVGHIFNINLDKGRV